MTADSDEVARALAERALERWELTDPRLRFVSRAENVVFKLEAAEGDYALRVHRPGYHTLAELNSEQVWTEALARAGVGVPLPLGTRHGDRYAVVNVSGSDQTRHVGIVSWFEGERLRERIDAETEPARRALHFRRLGGLMADIHNASSAWEPPDGFTRHHLDVDGLMGDAPFWGPFWEFDLLSEAQRTLVLKVRDGLRRRLSAFERTRDSYGMIHADLHPSNVLVHGDRVHAIDFDDAGFGWQIYELTVGLFNYSGSPDYEAYRDALVAGYRERRPLAEEQVALLPLLYLVRGLTLLGWYHQRPELERGDRLARLVRWVTRRAAEFPG